MKVIFRLPKRVSFKQVEAWVRRNRPRFARECSLVQAARLEPQGFVIVANIADHDRGSHQYSIQFDGKRWIYHGDDAGTFLQEAPPAIRAQAQIVSVSGKFGTFRGPEAVKRYQAKRDECRKARQAEKKDLSRAA